MKTAHSTHRRLVQQRRRALVAAARLAVLLALSCVHPCAAQATARGSLDGNAVPESDSDRSVSLPPGIDPTQLLSASESGGISALLSLQEAIQTIAESSIHEITPPDTPAELSIVRRVRAEHFYAQGREALFAKRTFQALQLFEAASKIDPQSPAILRQIARAQIQIRGRSAALVSYRKLLEVKPGDEEATLAIAIEEVNLRRFSDAAHRLTRWSDVEHGMTHDAGADIVRLHMLAMCFGQLGFDRAEAEALVLAMSQLHAPDAPGSPDFPGSASIYADRLSIMRSRIGLYHVEAGDAFYRAGMMQDARREWRRAGDAGIADIQSDTEELLRRMLLSDLIGDEGITACDRFVAAISSRELSENDLRLAVWLNRSISEEAREHAARTIETLTRAHPDSVQHARLAAAFLPANRAAESLLALIDRHSQDGELLDQLFELLHQSDDAHLLDVAAGMIERNPQRAIEIADHFAWVVGDDHAMVNRLVEDRNGALSKFLLSRLWHRIGATGRAWDAAAEALAIDPDHRATLVLRIELAGALKDPELIDTSIKACAAIRDTDAFIRQSRTLREARYSTNAAEYALAAIGLSPDDPEAWALHAHALLDSGDDLHAAINAANRALALDPHIDEAYDVLISIYEPNGPAPDANRLREVGRRLRRDHPDSLLLGTLTAEEFRKQSGFARSESILLHLHEVHPKANRPIEELMTTWSEMGDLSRCARWLDHGLQVRPHDPRLIRQRSRIFLLQGNLNGAERFLNERLNVWPADPVALSLKEVVLRRQGRDDEAHNLARQRITRRPPGIETQIRLLWLANSASHEDEATLLMNALHDRVGTVARPVAKRIAATATLLEPGGEMLEQQRFNLIDAYVRRFPDAPFQMYSAGLVASARLGTDKETFRGLVTHALTHAGDANDMTAIHFHQIALEIAETKRIDLAGILLDEALRHPFARPNAQTAALAQMAQACYIMARQRHDAVGVIDFLESKQMLAELPINRNATNLRAEALYALGVYCTLMSRDTDATVLFRSVLELDDAHTMSRNNLGYSMIELGDGSALAIEMIERAHAAMPNDPNILDTIGWLRYKQQRFSPQETNSGAAAFLQRANMQLGPDDLNPEGLDHFGDTLWRLGRAEPAIETWENTLSLAEDDAYQTRTMQGYLLFQQQVWGIVLVTPRSIFDRLHTQRIESLRAKIKAGREGGDPPVAPTFAELREGAE